MSWEIKVNDEFTTGILSDLVYRAKSYYNGSEDGIDESALGKAVERAIDEGMMYKRDMLSAILFYGHVEEAFASLVFDELWADVFDYAYDEIERGE